MAFIGNTNLTQSFTPAIDYFSGNASTVAFTLSRPVVSAAQIQVVVENVPQAPGDAFSVSGSTLTFTSAPPSGTNNIYVYYVTLNSQLVQPGQGTVGTNQIANGSVNNTKLDVASLSGTGAAQMPVGTTAQRPTGAAGYYRFNTTTGRPEWYSASEADWVPFNEAPSYEVNYLVVAGGGGGAAGYGNGNGTGGGGAGGYRASTTFLFKNEAYTVTIGAGGAGGTGTSSQNVSNQSTSGSNSVLGDIVSTGGGGGGDITSPTGKSGGSGGGGSANGQAAGGSGVSGQGFAGGTGYGAGVPYRGGGGGGASAAGGEGSASGNGGAGTASTISGSSVTYAGGGGGGAYQGYSGGTGGAGGGGGGGAGTGSGTAGTTNRGAGGGGGGWPGSGTGGNGGAGGSGIVVISYPGAQRGTGGTVTSVGGFTIHTFTTSGTYIA